MDLQILVLLLASLTTTTTMGTIASRSQPSSVHLKLGQDEHWTQTFRAHHHHRVHIEIECPVESLLESQSISRSQLYLVNWFKNDKKLSVYNRRIHMEDSFLRIPSASQLDSGDYTCEIITGSGLNLKSPKLTIQLLHEQDKPEEEQEDETETSSFSLDYDRDPDGLAPVFENQVDSTPLLRLESSQVDFDCTAYGQPKPQILWYKDGHIISEEEFGIVRDSMSLQLDNLFSSDSGLYQCIVANKFGQLNRTFDLQVLEKETRNITVFAGEMALFECRLTTQNLLPSIGQSIKWYKLPGNSSQASFQLHQDVFSSLSVFSIDYPPTIGFSPDLNRRHPTSILAELVSQLDPRINIIKLNDGSLVLRTVKISDQGLYVCSNPDSRQWSRRIRLNVVARQPEQSPAGVSSSQFFRSLILLFVVVCVFFVLLGLLLKYLCGHSRSDGKSSSAQLSNQFKSQPQSLPISRRLTSSPKDYEYYSNRWYSESRQMGNYTNYAPGNYAMIGSMNGGAETGGYFTSDRRMHLNPSGLYPEPNRIFLSTRSTSSNSRAASLSKSCSRVSNR